MLEQIVSVSVFSSFCTLLSYAFCMQKISALYFFTFIHCSQNTILKNKKREKNNSVQMKCLFGTLFYPLHAFWSFVTLQSFYSLNSWMSKIISHLSLSLLLHVCLVFVERFILLFIIFNVTMEISTSVTLCSLLCKPFNKTIILPLSLSKYKR